MRDPEQLALLSHIKTFAPARASTMIPPEFSLISFRHRIYGLTRRLGLTRQHGLNLHGLRHEYAVRRYADITGQPGPLQGDERVDPEKDLHARHVISRDLGHTRKYIVGAYVGGRRFAMRRRPAEPEATGGTAGDPPEDPEVKDEMPWRRRDCDACPESSPEIPDSFTTPAMPAEKKKHVTTEDTEGLVPESKPARE